LLKHDLTCQHSCKVSDNCYAAISRRSSSFSSTGFLLATLHLINRPPTPFLTLTGLIVELLCLQQLGKQWSRKTQQSLSHQQLHSQVTTCKRQSRVRSCLSSMVKRTEEESIYAWGRQAPAAGPTVNTYNVPAPATAPNPTMHADSSQVRATNKLYKSSHCLVSRREWALA